VRHERIGAALLAVLASSLPAHAQTRLDEVPSWVESETLLPTVLRTTGLIPVETPGSDLRFGIDPASVTVGKDQVIRYVVVATSASGAINAMQEGVRCDTREVKTYARFHKDSGWRPVEGAAWRPLSSGVAATRHSAIIARGGLCGINEDTGMPRDVTKVLRDLRIGVPTR